jgi:superfamily II DNA or RNA helicase
MRRPAIVLPTGVGKTVVFSQVAALWPGMAVGFGLGRRVLVLAHRTELIDQAAAKLRSVAPWLSIGIVKGNRNETLADVVVASVQTLAGRPAAERRRLMLRDVGLVIVDECHHAAADSYLTILQHFGCFETAGGGAVALGVTATMVRGDEKALGDVWQDVVYEMTVADAIAAGWLVRPRGKLVRVDDLDLSQVRKTRGDYSEADLGAALEASMAPELIAKAVAEHAQDLPTILFAPTVASARVIGDALSSVGRQVGTVYGAMAADARKSILDQFEADSLDLMSNCMVLTEGFDSPKVACVVIARPTTNGGLYRQMVGRSLRPYPGKTGALVLDVVGASKRHSLSAHVNLFGDELVFDQGDAIEELADELDELDAEGELTASSAFGLEREEVYATGPVVVEEVDLFHGSTHQWLRTYGGVWFLAAGDRYVAIVPGQRAGTYDVTSMHRYQRGTGRWVIQGVEDRSYAMAWAEGDVTPSELTTAKKERGWRRAAPSDKQRGIAARYGVVIPDGATSGEASNLIGQAMASARIDPITQALVRAYGR